SARGRQGPERAPDGPSFGEAYARKPRCSHGLASSRRTTCELRPRGRTGLRVRRDAWSRRRKTGEDVIGFLQRLGECCREVAGEFAVIITVVPPLAQPAQTVGR